MKRPAYIAAPYAAPTPDGIARNVRRAVAVARLATEEGYAPICIHPAIQAGAYGDDSLEHLGRGLRVREAQIRAVAAAGGSFWYLHCDDGSMSGGVFLEAEIWHEVGEWRSAVGMSWDSCGWRFERAGLADLWRSTP